MYLKLGITLILVLKYVLMVVFRIAEGVLRGGHVLARAADAAYDGQRAATADREPRGRPPRPRAAGGAGRGKHYTGPLLGTADREPSFTAGQSLLPAQGIF